MAPHPSDAPTDLDETCVDSSSPMAATPTESRVDSNAPMARPCAADSVDSIGPMPPTAAEIRVDSNAPMAPTPNDIRVDSSATMAPTSSTSAGARVDTRVIMEPSSSKPDTDDVLKLSRKKQRRVDSSEAPSPLIDGRGKSISSASRDSQTQRAPKQRKTVRFATNPTSPTTATLTGRRVKARVDSDGNVAPSPRLTDNTTYDDRMQSEPARSSTDPPTRRTEADA